MGRMTGAQCLAKFRADHPTCSRDNGCTVGRIEDAKHLEDTMARGICRNPECPNAGERLRLVARGFCSKCYPKVLKGLIPDPDKQEKAEPVDPLEIRECPEECIEGGGLKAENSPLRLVHEAETTGENKGTGVAACQDHSGESTKMVPDLPEDLDRPFHFGGFNFGPAPHRRMVGSHLAAITAKSLSLRTGVINEHDLGRYDYARIAVSTDGKALAVKFYPDKRPGARKIQLKRRSNALIAMEPLVAQHPEWIGREAPLESMGVEGWFLMRVGGEAA